MAEAPSNRIAVGEDVLGELFDRANTVLDKARASALEPEKEKVLRRFTLKEATRTTSIKTWRALTKMAKAPKQQDNPKSAAQPPRQPLRTAAHG